MPLNIYAAAVIYISGDEMFARISARRYGKIFAAAFAAVCFGLMLVFPEGCKKGAAEGLELCLSVLIPSLFPFMAAAGLVVKLGLCRIGGKKFPLLPVVLLSLIGGYPVGAATAAEMYRSGQLTEKQAKTAVYCLVCAGPGFLLGFVGGIYGSESVGLTIYAAQAASAVLFTAAANIQNKNNKMPSAPVRFTPPPFGTALVESAHGAAVSMVSIGGLAVLFGAFGGILDAVIQNGEVRRYLCSSLEVCTAVKLLGDCPVEICAFAVGFGGICVHFQIFASLGELKISRVLFFFIRILQGLVTALLTHAGLRLFVREAAVFSTSTAEKPGFYGGSALSGAALLTVAVCFLLTLRNYRR